MTLRPIQHGPRNIRRHEIAVITMLWLAAICSLLAVAMSISSLMLGAENTGALVVTAVAGTGLYAINVSRLIAAHGARR